MQHTLSRRDFLYAARMGAMTIGLAELGFPSLARAEDNFAISIVGGTWGQGQIKTYITETDFEKKNNVTISYDYAQDNIRAAKAIASCGNPVFTTVEALNSQAVLLAEGGCVADYDLDIVTNYKDVLSLSKEQPRKGLNNYFAGSYLMAIGLTYNTKEAGEPTSFEDLLSPKFKGRIAIPSFDWFGPQFLYAVNGALGGTNDNVDRGMQFIAELVKKNNAILLSSSDAGMQAFTRGEIIAMPYWNGRTNLLGAQRRAGEDGLSEGLDRHRQRPRDPQEHQVLQGGQPPHQQSARPRAAGEARHDLRLPAIERHREAAPRVRRHARSPGGLRAGGAPRLRHHDRQLGQEPRPLEQGGPRLRRAHRPSRVARRSAELAHGSAGQKACCSLD